MAKFKEEILYLSLLALIPFTNIIYKILNNSSRTVHILVTNIDRCIPFLKIFIIPYILWYVFIAFVLIYLCIKNKFTYIKTLTSLICGMLICYLVYFFYQTTVPRPVLADDDFLTKLINIIYIHDNPYNCFPSIHVLSSYIMIKGIYKANTNKAVNAISFICAVLIILSTQFVKQHVLLDMLSAILLGELIFDFIYMLDIDIVISRIKKPFLSLFIKKKYEH